ncbi:MAG: AraC family transcriptional regulator [bacterium]|nr:AraC family transcriptional regulator [bacterium]
MVFNVYHAAIDQLTSAEQKMLSQSETTNDFILRDINSTANTVFENELVAIQAMSQPYTTMRSAQISSLISEMRTRTSAIYKVYFFNLKDDYIYTGENPIYHTKNFPDKELLSIIPNSDWYTVNLPHTLKYEDNMELREEQVLLSLYKYSDTSCMAVFINANVFNSMVNTEFENKKQSMMILKSNGTVMSSTDPEQFGKDLSEDKIVKKINQQTKNSGYINDFGTIYCYKKSNTLNSLYICSFRSSSVIVSYIWQFAIIILFAFLLILLYFISSMHMSMSIFRPFKKLRSDIFRILDLSEPVPGNDLGTEQDLMVISKNLRTIRAKYDSMKETEQLYSETKQNELMYCLITGTFYHDTTELDEYDICLSFPHNTMLLVRLDNTKSIVRSDIGFIQYGIANSGTELLTNEGMRAYSTTYSDDYDIIFLINHSSPIFDIECAKRLQKYVSSAFGITVSLSYDSSDNSLESIAEMYRNVKEAMQYRMVKGHNSIIEYTSVMSDISSNREYPYKHEKAVVAAINKRNPQEAEDAVDAFLNAIRDMPYSYIVIHSSVLITAIHSRIKQDKNSDSRSDVISTTILRMETLEELREILIAKCNDAIISMSSDETTDKYMMIANSIELFINDHYTDPNLSIDSIASYAGKSANYTRNIFKQNKGISISEYILEKRFAEVKRLLANTSLTSQAIAQKVGMNSGSYFYTAFKKYTGYTPEQYRRLTLTMKEPIQ